MYGKHLVLYYNVLELAKLLPFMLSRYVKHLHLAIQHKGVERLQDPVPAYNVG